MKLIFILSEHEKKISNSKSEIKLMIENANNEAEKNILKTNKADFIFFWRIKRIPLK